MPRKKSPTLTEAELRLMNILWDRGPATVNDVVAALPRREALAYSSVLTTLRILEEKGYVTHTKEGRAHVFSPRVAREEVRRSALKFVLSRFFDGSPELLVQNLLAAEEVDVEEVRRLKKLIRERGP